MANETPEERKERLVAEIKERAIELMSDDAEVSAHSLGETQVFDGTGRSVDTVCIGYYSSN